MNGKRLGSLERRSTTLETAHCFSRPSRCFAVLREDVVVQQEVPRLLLVLLVLPKVAVESGCEEVVGVVDARCIPVDEGLHGILELVEVPACNKYKV